MAYVLMYGRRLHVRECVYVAYRSGYHWLQKKAIISSVALFTFMASSSWLFLDACAHTSHNAISRLLEATFQVRPPLNHLIAAYRLTLYAR